MTEHSEICRHSKRLKRDKIVRLWNEGKSADEIAWLTGSTPDSVYSTISALRRNGAPVDRRKTSRPAVAVDIRADLISVAEVEAQRRGLTIRQLASRILLAVLADRMVAAVLDDGREAV